MKRMRAVESDSVKSARKAKDKLDKPFKARVSETCEQTLQAETKQCAWQVYHRYYIYPCNCDSLIPSIYGMRESRDSDQFLVNTQVHSHALLRRGFGTSVPFIFVAKHTDTRMQSFSLKFTNCLKWLIETLANYITD